MSRRSGLRFNRDLGFLLLALWLILTGLMQLTSLSFAGSGTIMGLLALIAGLLLLVR